MDDSLLEGLYERLITAELAAKLSGAPSLTADRGLVDDADAPEILARHVRDVVLRALRGERSAEKRLALVNDLITRMESPRDHITTASQLLQISKRSVPGMPARPVAERPSTPLSDAALLTNAQGEPGMGHEVRAELASADHVDVIMAFVKWYGLRLFEDRMSTLRERGVPLRVITTTYMGATERQALDRLVR